MGRASSTRAESVAGLQTGAGDHGRGHAAHRRTATRRKDYIAFCNGEVGMLMGPGLEDRPDPRREDGCPDMEDKIGAFALPGNDGRTTAPAFLGGSNLAHLGQEREPELAYDLLKIMASDELPEAVRRASACIPARSRCSARSSGDEGAQAQAKAAENTRFVPSQRALGRRSRRPPSCRTCWSPSPRAATSRPRRGQGRRGHRGDPQPAEPAGSTATGESDEAT